MPRHQLPRVAMLEYALHGALTTRGVYAGSMDEEEEAQLDKDIAEIERRLELAKEKEQGAMWKSS